MLNKKSDWRDMVDELAGEVGVSVAGAALLGIASGPVGLILGGLGLAATLYFSYKELQRTNANIDDLIDKLEDIDTNDQSEPLVSKWMNDLKAFKPIFSIQEVPEGLEEKGQLNAQKLSDLTGLHNYLLTIQRTWPQVKATLTDWGWDAKQAENAINLTTNAVKQSIEGIKAAAKQNVVKYMDEQKGQIDYKTIAYNIDLIHNEIKKITGNPPVYETPNEMAALSLARKINSGDVEVDQLKQYGSALLQLEKDLASLLQRAKKADYHPIMSKYAVRLFSERPQTRSVNKAMEPHSGVKALQKLINNLHKKYETGITIQEDGLYGPNTAGAFAKLFDYPTVEKYFKTRGVSREMAEDYRKARSNMRVILNAIKAAPVEKPAETTNYLDILKATELSKYNPAYTKGNVYDYIKYNTRAQKRSPAEADRIILKVFNTARSRALSENPQATFDDTMAQLMRILSGGTFGI